MAQSRLVGLIAAMLLCAACGTSHPTLDTSSEAAFNSSTERMMEPLQPAQRQRLESALETLVMQDLARLPVEEFLDLQDRASVWDLVKGRAQALHGLNGDEIIVEADAFVAENR